MKRTVKTVFVLAALPLLLFGGPKPNIVLLMAEDISVDLSCYGTKGVSTPTLDALAARGIRYDRFYTTSSGCSPSRSAIMSGVHQGTTNSQHHRKKEGTLLPGTKPLTHYLRDAGYTCLLGSPLVYEYGLKTDLNFEFDRNTLFESPMNFAQSKTYWSEFKGYPEPFFQQIQLKMTHRDAKNPRWAKTRVASKNPVNPAEVEVPPFFPDVPEVREDISNYLDMIQYADGEVKAVLEDLRKNGVLENTVIIFIGDNGACQVRGKIFMYEAGIRCPLIVSGKGIPEGEVCEDLISGIDLTATILHLAGVDIPSHMQGQAFLDNPGYKPREFVFAARDQHDNVLDCSRAVVGKRYKYIRNFMPQVPWDAKLPYFENPLVRPLLPVLRKLHEEGKLNADQDRFFNAQKPEEELYDLSRDPYELNNLAADPEYAGLKKKMSTELIQWAERTGDRGLKRNEKGEWAAATVQAKK